VDGAARLLCAVFRPAGGRHARGLIASVVRSGTLPATTEVDFRRGRGERSSVIASVAFRKFKALRETSLTLVPFNLVIGPNGSGKTSLIQALLRLRTLSKLPLAEGERRTDGPEIEFRFFPPHDSVQARLGCRSEVVCDLLQVIPADAPGWPTLRERVGHIRSYFF